MTLSNSNTRVFISLLDWGLGHATRLLPLIKYLRLQSCTIYIGASGRAREVLRQEVPESVFLDYPRYPVRYSRSRFFVTRFMLTTFPAMLITMIRENRRLQKLHDEFHFDLIISDNRFSARHRNVISVLISHQLRYKLPWPLRKMEWLPEYFNARLFNKYDHIIIPDISDPDSYTAELSHNMRYLDQKKLYYAGILSSLSNQIITEDDSQSQNSGHDLSLRSAKRRSNLMKTHVLNMPTPQLNYLVIISGPEPQRTQFENLIKEQIHHLTGNVAVAMGLPEKKYIVTIGVKKFYTYLNRAEMAGFMSKADFIIARPGYTTVMEMIELARRGLFIPTPGQVEQEYLARYYKEQNWCYFVPQHKLNLKSDIDIAKTYPGFPVSRKTVEQNVEQLFELLMGMRKGS